MERFTKRSAKDGFEQAKGLPPTSPPQKGRPRRQARPDAIETPQLQRGVSVAPVRSLEDLITVYKQTHVFRQKLGTSV